MPTALDHDAETGRIAIDQPLDALETPVPVVDLARLERNLDRMAAYASAHGLGLRPHIKTHKTPWIAAEQRRRGAVGVTCATPREAELMSAVVDDILVAYPPVGDVRARRIAELPRDVTVTVALDSAEAIESAAAAARAADRPLRVLVELDLGMRRVGVATATEAARLARLVRQRPPLEYAGIAFYPGHVRQHVADQDAGLDALRVSLGAVLEELRAAGVAPAIVSGGSTPTAYRTHEIPGVTEFRPGTYVYNDRTTAEVGACDWDDCALTVLARVVSTAVPGQAVIDAGTKALGREPLRASGGEEAGYGALLEHPEVTVRAMSEEHGILELKQTTWQPRVGELVRVVPNHVCIVVHLNDEVIGTRDGRAVARWKVAARGR